MDPQIITQQIVKHDDYSLELSTDGTIIVLNLFITISKRKTDVYQITLNSLNDVDKLAAQFKDIEEFLNHIRDPDNIQVNIQKKAIVIVQYSKRKKQFIPITSIQLKKFKSIEKTQEQALVENIVQRCTQKKPLTNEEIMDFFQNIAKVLGQNQKSKNESKAEIQKQEKQIRGLRNQIEDIQVLSESKIKQFEKNLSNYQDDIHKKINQIRDQLEKNNEKETKNRQQSFYQLKQDLEKDISVLGFRLEKVEKLLEKKDLKIQENMIIKMQQPSKSIKSIENKGQRQMRNMVALDWVDPLGKDYKKLVLYERRITCGYQYGNWVYGKKKLLGQCQYSIKCIKIKDDIKLGVSDSQNRGKNWMNWNKNRVHYQSSGDCQISDQKVDYSQGYKQGEIVTVAINTNSGLIQWKVGDSIRHQERVQMLKDKTINWIPFITLSYQDCVQIIS